MPRRRILALALAAAGAALLLLARCGEDPTGPDSGPRVRIDARTLHLAPGDTSRFVATLFRDGRPVDAAITWSSSAPEVATVDDGGLVTAVALGETEIVAEAAGARDALRLLVLPPVLVGAGDIASCGSDGDEATAALLDTIPGLVFTAGDNAYGAGTVGQFADCYAPSWGRHRDRTRPAAGNREYRSAGAAPYFAYFGERAGERGKGYYGFEFAGWHIVVLNSEIDRSEDSPQLRWLREDLAAHPTRCTLAIWHRPRFSSGAEGDDASQRPFWEALYDAGAELVVNGHDHYYERFAPQAPDGTADPERGIREFVVGTGGQPPYPPDREPADREVQQSTTLGVLKLTLRPDGYDWEFVPAAGGEFRDAGSDACH